MKRGYLILIIIAMSAILVFAYITGTKQKLKSETKSENFANSQQKNKALYSEKLKVVIMPAADIIEQVRDVARAVASGDTKPGLALSIYSQADEYLTDARVKIDELNVTGQARRIKQNSDRIIKESVKNVDDLTYLTKVNNKEKLKNVADKLDSGLAELRRLFKAPSKSEN